ncbi:signal peptidase II [Agrococcus sp. SGAir0287]|uniref:signal peptidase II n=1 Tax=Agrococcus sp. SGAir0287 TaxID=2070347 RepID=UPI0010CD3802|nr:signal peptidase II [Agrococcus sp. SGAir0287]QCR19496.1 signal peptidase II [Agrococcus sp. SGAir0287]
MTASRGVAWRLVALIVGLAAVVWAVDLLVKEWVLATLPEGRQVQVLGEVLQWHFVRNPGAAFSLAAGMTWIFTLISAVVAVAVVVVAFRVRSLPWAIVLGCLLGGVVGNLTDRIIREPGGLQGHVIDFIQVWGFPAIFNVADMFVVCAMGAFIVLVLRGEGIDGVRRTDEPGAEPEPAAEESAEPEARSSAD